MPKGTARHLAAPGKSCSLTSSACLRHVRPLFLKSPINSFFFVSILMIGRLAVINCCFWDAMYLNCSSLSGHPDLPCFLLLAFREKPIFLSKRATVLPLVCCPSSASRLLNRSTLLRIHLCSVIGSPAISSLSICSNAVTTVGSFSSVSFRPPPGRRIR